MGAQGLVHGPLGESCLHLCVDMQRLFGPGYPWAVPWLEKVLPAIEASCAQHSANTVFTRFIPVVRAGEGRGTRARYYRRWGLERIGEDAVRLVLALERFVPPARIVDKLVYSPWTEGGLDRLLAGVGVDTVIISGGETDVCVLATFLGAINRRSRDRRSLPFVGRDPRRADGAESLAIQRTGRGRADRGNPRRLAMTEEP